MLKDDVIKLCTINRTQDAYGRWMETTTTRREVYAQVTSISRSEFFAAGRDGMKPEWCFKVFSGDYQGETVVEYKGEPYSIYRTYEPDDYIELYVERKGGTDG